MLPVTIVGKKLNGPGSSGNEKCTVHTFQSKDFEDTSVGTKPFILTIVTQSKTKTEETKTRTQPGLTTEEEITDKDNYAVDKYEQNEKRITTENSPELVKDYYDDGILKNDLSSSALDLTTVKDKRMTQSTESIAGHHQTSITPEINNELVALRQDDLSSSRLRTPAGESGNNLMSETLQEIKGDNVMDDEVADLGGSTDSLEEECNDKKRETGGTFDAGTGIVTNEGLFLAENKEDNEQGDAEEMVLKVKRLGKRKKHVSQEMEEKNLNFKCLILNCGAKFAIAKHLKCHIMENHLKIETPKCQICNESQPSTSCLVSHIRKKHSETFNFQCDVCELGFHHKRGMELHMLKTHTGEGVVCKYCLKKFADSKSYKEHEKQSHSGDHKYLCNICQKRFRSQISVEQHKMRKHNAPKPYTCEICGASLVSKSEIIQHRLIHTKEKPFECLDCGQSLQTKCGIRSHLRSHLDQPDDGPFMCELCGKMFKTKYLLNLHKYRENQKMQKRHVCDTCGAAFPYSRNLAIHMRKHTGEQPYKCDICFKAFRARGTLNAHIKATHEGKSKILPKKLSCLICGHSKSSFSELKIHLRKHTGEHPFACTQCDATYVYKKSLKKHFLQRHSEQKPFSCLVCKACFASKDQLSYHKAVHEPEKYKSSDCNKAMACSKTLHRKECTFEPKKRKKPRKCHLCFKSFCSGSSANRHLKRVHKIKNTETVPASSPKKRKKPRKCHLCFKSFCSGSSANRHLKRVHKIKNTETVPASSPSNSAC